jgi:DNA primase
MRTQQAKQLSLPDLLTRLGYQPALVSGDKLWYCSPLRSESRPSFCVKPGKKVAWVFSDYGANVKGNILDFVLRYRQCDLKEALLWLEQIFGAHCSITLTKQQFPPSPTSEIQPYCIKHIQHAALLAYLKKRAIKIDLANRYLREVHYHMGDCSNFALGWKTDAGGWSLRAKDFKASVRPAAITTVGGNNQSLAIFEGMFDFLAALAYYQIPSPRGQVIILNGVNFTHFAIQKINGGNYRSIKLFLDNDLAGRKATQQLLALKNTKDCSAIFGSAKDFAQFYETIVG